MANKNGVVDLRTRISNLHNYIAAIDDQTQTVRETTDQLQREQKHVKKGFNELLTELISQFGTAKNNLEEFGFKIQDEGLLIGNEVNEGNLQENVTPVRDLLKAKDAGESKEVEDFIVEVGIQFSYVVVEFLLFMLERKELETEYQRFTSLVSDSKSSMEISSRITALIEIVEAEFKKKKAEELRLGIKSPVSDSYVPYAECVKEKEMKGLIQKILYRILHLESIWRFRCPPDWLIVTREMVLNLETRLGEFKQGLDEIDNKFIELRDEYFPYFVKNEEAQVKAFGKKIEMQILGLWKPLEHSNPNKKRKSF